MNRFESGVQSLLGRMRVACRLSLAAGVLLLPLLGLGAAQLHDRAAALGAVQLQQAGLLRLGALHRVVGHVDDHRVLTDLALRGGDATPVAAAARRADRAYDALLETVRADRPVDADIDAEIDALREVWNRLQTALLGAELDADESLARHQALLARALALNGRIAESTHLSLSGRPTDLVLTHAALLQGALLTQKVQELRGQGMRWLHGGRRDDAKRESLQALSRVLPDVMQTQLRALGRVEAELSQQQPRFDAGVREMRSRLERFIARIDGRDGLRGLSSGEVYALGAYALLAIDQVREATVLALAANLDAEAARLRRELLLTAVGLGLVVLAAWLIAMASARSVARPLEHIGQVLERAVQGQTQLRCGLNGPDEIAQLARRIDRMMDERSLAEQALRDSEARFRSLTELSADWYWEQDAEFRFTELSRPADRKSGYTVSSTVGKRRWELGDIVPLSCPWDEHKAMLEAHLPFSDFEFRRTGEDGKVRIVSITGSPIFDAAGRFSGYRGVGRDITQRRQAEEQLAYLAEFDTLTGLPNRHMLHHRLAAALQAAGSSGTTSACMFVDLDRFKFVNDTYGHAAGDALLCEVARRLQHCLRSSDTAGRLGGDEFAVVLTHIAGPDDAGIVAQKMIDALVAPFDLGGHAADISASIGIAVFPDDGRTADELLKNADKAMYRAKERGRNNYQLCRPRTAAGAPACAATAMRSGDTSSNAD